MAESFTYDHRGTSYLDLLKRFHTFLAPTTYFEIGTLSGGTLALSECATVCVDPAFQIAVNPTAIRPVTMLFQQTSDRFFESHDLSALFGRPVELAFLDGLHEAETLLRDFYNVERHCKPNSIICMHDCVPMNAEMTARENTGGMWTGDVWKVIPILKKHRPDIDVYVFDAGPTGLVCCTNLNPSDTSFKAISKEIWSEWRSIEISEYGLGRLIEDSDILSTESVSTAEDMRRYFWL